MQINFETTLWVYSFLFFYVAFSPSLSHILIGISVSAVALEIFRQSILSTYHYHNGYGILMYLDHIVIVVQQSILLYLVSNSNSHTDSERTVEHTAIRIHFNYVIVVGICMTVILPTWIFDYLIVSSVVAIYATFFSMCFLLFLFLFHWLFNLFQIFRLYAQR